MAKLARLMRKYNALCKTMEEMVDDHTKEVKEMQEKYDNMVKIKNKKILDLTQEKNDLTKQLLGYTG